MRAKKDHVKPTITKQAVACLVNAAMVATFTPMVAWGGTASGAPYVNAAGILQSTESEPIIVSNGDANWGSDGRIVIYVATSNVTIDSRITVHGHVHLILSNGCNLTVNGGIKVPDDSGRTSLTICGTGTLIADAGNTGNAGIGGDSSGSGGKIEIIGGTVMAYSYSGAGIGGGSSGSGGQVTISGGTVTASSTDGEGIGKGNNLSGDNQGSFTTTASGNAVIFASSISDQSNRDKWSGVICEGSSSDPVFYGTSVTPTDSFTIPNGKTLTVPEGKTLTVPEGVTLTNEGTITIADNGTIINKGTFNKGTFAGDSASFLDESGSSAECYGAIGMSASSTSLASGWYVVNNTAPEGITISSRVTVTGDVHLILADGCKLTASKGMTVSAGNSLSIYGQAGGTGKLIAQTDQFSYAGGAGIGGEENNGAGSVTINGGTVDAISIGGAGLGGGSGGAGGSVQINGGTVTASSSSGAGIGGGGRGSGGTITISGGTVTATSSSGAGIGAGQFGSGGIFKTQEENSTSGNAVIFASSISDKNQKDSWSGVIFEDSSGKVYGSGIIEPGMSFEVPSGATLTIPEGKTLAISKGKTLTNNGTIENSGNIYVDGTLSGTVSNTGQGAVYYPLTLNGNGGTVATAGTGIESNDGKQYYNSTSGATLPTPTKEGYTFGGWYETSDFSTNSVTEITAAETGTKTYWAKWNAIYVPPSDPSYNVPATAEGGVAVKATVNGSTAVVADISASALESAAGSGAATVTIDLSGLPKGTTQAQLSKSTVDKLLAVVNDTGNAVESVTMNLGGAVLTIDAKALAAISEQAKGASVTLGVTAGSADSLSVVQQQALSPFEVVELYFEAQVKCGGAEVHDFGGGSVSVSVAFEPLPGHDPARYVVLYVGEDGSIERYSTAWADGLLSFMAPHFSAYAVVYVEDATQAAIEALEVLPVAGKLKTNQAKKSVKRAESALGMVAALDDGQKMLVDEALVANAQEVVVSGNALVAKADKKAAAKVRDKGFSVKAGASKSIYFKTKLSAAGTKVTYKKSSGSKYITVTKSGKVTAKKGMRAGKTYTAKVKVTCGKAVEHVKVAVRAR